MAAMDVSSWGFSGTPELAMRQDSALNARSPGRSIWRALGRCLYAAALASAVNEPQAYAMIHRDRLQRSIGGH